MLVAGYAARPFRAVAALASRAHAGAFLSPSPPAPQATDAAVPNAPASDIAPASASSDCTSAYT
jgi:hypothetical protein